MSNDRSSPPRDPFASDLLDRVRQAGNVWRRPWGEVRIPRVFGFCRGVRRALSMLERALYEAPPPDSRYFLLGQIIHNPWVNEHFEQMGVRILTPEQRDALERYVGASDTAVIPAFGVPLPIEKRLGAIGCRIVDTTCGDVLRLHRWAQQSADEGYGVLIYGRARHDETVVTKSRLDAAGARYVVTGSMEEVRQFARMLVGEVPADRFREAFGPDATNADSLGPFLRTAQVSQTTMLYEDTLRVREMLQQAFGERFGDEADQRLRFQPTVCRATQDRQSAAVELCSSGCDLTLVVGGFGSSNTRHLFELAGQYGPSFFIEDAAALLAPDAIRTFDPRTGSEHTIPQWCPPKRPLVLGVLAGASSPEIVVEDVLERLAKLLG